MKWFDIKNKNYWRVGGKKEYSIQEVSKLSGITVRTLRNYLKIYDTLLNPKRGYYNSLIFSSEDLQIFVMIKTLIKDGFKQEDIIKTIEKELENLKLEEKEVPSSLPEEIKTIEPKEQIDLPIESNFNEPHPLLKQMNQVFIQMEKRNALLENKLNSIENTLKEMAKPKPFFLSTFFSNTKNSIKAIYKGIVRAFDQE